MEVLSFTSLAWSLTFVEQIVKPKITPSTSKEPLIRAVWWPGAGKSANDFHLRVHLDQNMYQRVVSDIYTGTCVTLIITSKFTRIGKLRD